MKITLPRLFAAATLAIVISFITTMPEPEAYQPAPIVKQVRGIQGPSAVFDDF